ncbi:MAG: tripartite tricarboxylate transporter substrate binding protein, partial [Betaproteobacteria bacterium]|nr:tripartite tricarboxylate transporter substrate binding protein [Betaproteobacteria bacterium]
VDATAQPVRGDAYPTKPLRVIVPFPAGGGTDILARMIGAKITEAWGQPVVVDNRPGGSTVIGTEIVSKAPADGYTILFTASTHAVNASLYARLPYDSIRDFAPVTLLASAPNILVVHPSMPTRTLNEFIAFAKARPRQINYGSSGNSGTGHLAMEMLKSMTGIDLVHIPYKGGSPALNAVLAGEVSTLFNNIIAAVPQVKAGRLYALGVTSGKRSSAVPNVPTIAEAGVPGFEALAWFGVFAPAATPPKIVASLNAEIARVLRLPEIRKRLLIDGAEPVGNSPQEFAAVIRADIAKWARVIKAAGITPD